MQRTKKLLVTCTFRFFVQIKLGLTFLFRKIRCVAPPLRRNAHTTLLLLAGHLNPGSLGLTKDRKLKKAVGNPTEKRAK